MYQSKHILNIEKFNQKPVISVDFDGTLHTSTDVLGNPMSFVDYKSWKPNWRMISKIKNDAKEHTIVIVTARHSMDRKFIKQFVKLYDLPIADIYFTNNKTKRPILEKIKAIKHYDDNVLVKKDLIGSSVKFEYPIF